MNSPIELAPMIRRTDRHFRYLMRLLSPSVKLYTEMVTAAAVCHGDAHRLLAHHSAEHPVVLQLAGNNPRELAAAARKAHQLGYDAINFNVGCPSDRVQSGAFGVCLMKKPEVVVECMMAMQDAVPIPVTLKTRIGVDAYDSEAYFNDFIETVYQSGCRYFIIHARKAWLKGLNPKQNRTVPPLHYDRVYRLKLRYPEAYVVINGGIAATDAVKEHLLHVDGVMIGRALYQDPPLIQVIDRSLGLSSPHISRYDVIEGYISYMEGQIKLGAHPSVFLPHLMGMFYQQPGGRRWRQMLSCQQAKQGVGIDVVRHALDAMVDFSS